MPIILRVALVFLLLAVPCFSQQLSVVAASKCRSGLLVEVRFINSLHSQDISTPLSPSYQGGHTLGGARLEFYDPSDSRWKGTERGLDTHPAGTRVLEPGEAVNDLVKGASGRFAGTPIERVKFRAVVIFRIGKEKAFRTASSEPFFLTVNPLGKFSDEDWIKADQQICGTDGFN
jgi:hypothetical protein